MAKAIAALAAFAAEILFGALAALTVFEATAAFVHADGREDDLVVLRHPCERLTDLVGLEPLPRLTGVVACFLSLLGIRQPVVRIASDKVARVTAIFIVFTRPFCVGGHTST